MSGENFNMYGIQIKGLKGKEDIVGHKEENWNIVGMMKERMFDLMNIMIK